MQTFISLLNLLTVFILPSIFFSLVYKCYSEKKLVVDLRFLVKSVLMNIGFNTLIALLLFSFNVYQIHIILLINYLTLGVSILFLLFINQRLRNKEIVFLFSRNDLLFVFFLLIFLSFIKVNKHLASFDDGHLYVNGGVAMANHKSFFIVDEVNEELSLEENLLYDDGWNFMRIVDGIKKIPNALHFIHIWVAILYSIGGLDWVHYLGLIFGFISCLIFYEIVKDVVSNKKISFILSILFAANFIQVFFMKYVNTEIPFQALILGVVLLQADVNKNESFLDRLCIFFILFSLLMTRIESIVIILCLFVYFLFISLMAYRSRIKSNIVTIFLTLFGVSFYYIFISKNYLLFNFNAKNQNWLYALLIFILFLIVFLLLKINKTMLCFLKKHINLLFQVLTLIYLAVLFSYGLRRGRGFLNINSISWFIPLFLLLISLISYWQTIVTTIKNSKNFLNIKTVTLFLLLPVSSYFLLKLHNSPTYPWAMRRYITILFPIIFLGLAVFINRISKHEKIIVILISLIFLLKSVPILQFEEMGGVNNCIFSISNYIGDDSRIISFDASYPQVAYPLKFIYEKNIIMANFKRTGSKTTRIQPNSDEEISVLLSIVNKWIALEKEILLFNPSKDTIAIFSNAGYEFESYAQETCSFEVLTRNDIPDFNSTMRFNKNYSLYKLVNSPDIIF